MKVKGKGHPLPSPYIIATRSSHLLTHFVRDTLGPIFMQDDPYIHVHVRVSSGFTHMCEALEEQLLDKRGKYSQGRGACIQRD